MEDYETLELIGEGSTRKVYAINSKLCVKVAKNENGVVQNKAEIKNFTRGLKCFPKLDSYESNYEAIVVQRVVPCNGMENAEKAIANALKADGKRFLERLSRMLVWMAQMKLHAKDASQIVIDKSVDPLWRQLASKITKPKNAAQKALAQLADYATWNFEDFLAGDLDDIRNWGLVKNGKSVVPVVLDAGLTLPSVSRRMCS